MYGSQSLLTRGLHAPLPSHVAWRVSTSPKQLALRQTVEVEGYWQAVRLLPLHEPPQDEPSESQAVRVPCGAPEIARHWPSRPVTSQASHWPVHPLLQQKPSTQLPLSHEPSEPHAEPSGSEPVHTPPLQKNPVAH